MVDTIMIIFKVACLLFFSIATIAGIGIGFKEFPKASTVFWTLVGIISCYIMNNN